MIVIGLEVSIQVQQSLGHTTPYDIVPAPGTGKAILVDKIVVTMDYAGTPYATNTTLQFRYTNGAGTQVVAENTTLLASTADTVSMMIPTT